MGKKNRTNGFVTSIPIPDVMIAHPRGFYDNVIALDGDEVLFAFNDAFEAHARQLELSVRAQKSETYIFHRDPATGVTQSQTGAIMRGLMSTIGGVEFIEGAIDAVKSARGQNIGIRVLTALFAARNPSSEGGQDVDSARGLRTKQLLDAGVVAQEDHVLYCEAHLKPVAMLYHGLHIPVLVDDRESTLISVTADYGLIAIGIDSRRRHNIPDGKGKMDDYGVVWFKTLYQATPFILDLYARMQSLKLIGEGVKTAS